MKKVLVLGGYGVFGKRICRRLAKIADIELIIAGRNVSAAQSFADTLKDAACHVNFLEIDVNRINEYDLGDQNIFLFINACGPYHEQDYILAKFCIDKAIHYIDLADNREFVVGIDVLNEHALKTNVFVTSGASTVPAISSMIIDRYIGTNDPYDKPILLEELDYGVSPGNRTERGVGTVAAILNYLGKPFTTLIKGKMETVYGWQNTHSEYYPQMFFDTRYMANCNVPDLSLFPNRYPSLKTQRFYAGLELTVLHLGLWFLSWPCRWGLIKHPKKFAKLLRHISLWFYPFGGRTGGMHIKMNGRDEFGHIRQRDWHLIVKNGNGPDIPAVSSVILTKKLLNGTLLQRGAMPCMGLFSWEDFYEETKDIEPQQFLSAPLYKTLLWGQYNILPDKVQQLHDVEGHSLYEGICDVTRGKNIVCRILAMIMSLPPEGESQNIEVEFKREGRAEHWTRRFGKKSFYSLQYQKNRLLYEKINITTLVFHVETSTEKLSLKLKQVYTLGVPVGWLFKPQVIAEESEQNSKFHVNVEVHLPLFGLLVKYTAFLIPKKL